jgi:hypothetical protein
VPIFDDQPVAAIGAIAVADSDLNIVWSERVTVIRWAT